MWRNFIFWPLAILLLVLSGLLYFVAMATEWADEQVSRAAGAVTDWAHRDADGELKEAE
jgi:hypothetical protein